ncbi:MAG: tlpA 1 [Planctomycetaceae bacterium]|nr:tlpA 1 [Planctomycetaceae bacterium]
MLVTSRWAFLLAILGMTSCFGVLSAQEKNAEKPAAPKKTVAPAAEKPAADDVKNDSRKPEVKKEEVKKEDGEEKPADPFAVPKDAEPADLVAFIKKLTSGRRPQFGSQEEMQAYMKKLSVSILEASTLALDSKEIKDKDAEFCLSIRFQALGLQRRLEIEGADKLELELAEKYKNDKREKLAAIAKERLLFARLSTIKELKPEEQNLLLEEAIALVKGDGKLSRQSVQTAMQIGQELEQSGNEALAATAFEKFAEIFAESKDPSMSGFATKLSGTARRLRLPGSKLEIEGELVGGKPFDWSAYEGKVVLIDFWATWCGPCVQELPNVKQNYNGYHSKGFDVVGISLDEDQGKLESFVKKNKIPWSNLFSADEKATGWEHPLAVKYGVMGIPFTILVGKDGKVISTNVRGPKLGKALAEQLGEPDEAALKAAIEAESKAEDDDAKGEKDAEKKTDKSEKKEDQEKATKGKKSDKADSDK